MEIHQHCQKVMSHPAKMKRVWLEKSCINILSSEVKKVSLSDVAQFEPDPKIFNCLKVISETSNQFQSLLTDTTTFKMILLLLLTVPLKNSNPSELSQLHDAYMKTFLRRTDWICLGQKELASIIVEHLIKAANHFQMISASMELLLQSKWFFDLICKLGRYKQIQCEIYDRSLIYDGLWMHWFKINKFVLWTYCNICKIWSQKVTLPKKQRTAAK